MKIVATVNIHYHELALIKIITLIKQGLTAVDCFVLVQLSYVRP
jgi:hypothetical protein